MSTREALCPSCTHPWSGHRADPGERTAYCHHPISMTAVCGCGAACVAGARKAAPAKRPPGWFRVDLAPLRGTGWSLELREPPAPADAWAWRARFGERVEAARDGVESREEALTAGSEAIAACLRRRVPARRPEPFATIASGVVSPPSPPRRRTGFER